MTKRELELLLKVELAATELVAELTDPHTKACVVDDERGMVEHLRQAVIALQDQRRADDDGCMCRIGAPDACAVHDPR